MLFVLYPLRGGPWVPLPYAPWTRSPSLGLLQYAYIASAHLQHTSCLMRDKKKKNSRYHRDFALSTALISTILGSSRIRLDHDLDQVALRPVDLHSIQLVSHYSDILWH